MKVLEPTTTITDYILAVETIVFGILILRDTVASSQLSSRLLAFALLATALAAAAGGTYHGFFPSLNPFTAAALWKITIYAVGATTLLLLASAALSVIPPQFQKWMIAVAIAQFLFYAYWMIGHNEFKYVVFNYAPAMLVVLLLHGVAAAQDRMGSGWIVAGILVSFVAAGIQQAGLTLHRHFNHNDLYHVIQMAAMYLLYRGGLLLRDASMRVLS